jgi:hypothetical protein
LTLRFCGTTLGITVMENRKNQRFELRLPLEIIGGQAPLCKGETKNVSSCGVLFAASAPVAVGEAIEYLITLPKARGTRTAVRLRCIGKVVRKNEAGNDDSRPEEASEFAATLERYEFLREPK